MTVEIGPESEQLLKTTYDRLMERGRAEGRAEILIKMLEARFGTLPAAATERARRASVEELDLWGVAFVQARTLDDVFVTG